MRICILSNENKPIGFLDNEVPSALHFYDDKLHAYLTGTAHTFEFTTRADHDDSELLAVGNAISFVYKNKPYYLKIVSTSQTESEITVEAWAFCLELLNETSKAYSGTSMTFEEYLEVMVYQYTKFMELGVNEVSTKSISHEWEGSTDTILKRLYSLASVFDAEIEFVPRLNSDYSLDKIVMNVYKAHSDDDQGIGERRTDANYRYGKGVDGITKKQDITSLYTAINPTGKDGLSIAAVEDRTVYDDDGAVLYFHKKGSSLIYAPKAMEQFPSAVGADDKYVAYNWDTDYETAESLYGNALAKLKELSVPDSTYEIDGAIDVNIGDTITVIDESFNPPLYLETRVTEQEISFTDSSKNKSTFENTKELESKIDDSLSKRVEELAKEAATASAKADEASLKVDGVATTAADALKKANSAESTASSAQTAATAAQTAASNAESTAQTASKDAATAKSEASTASSKATEAASSASTASAQATAAANSASAAQTAANSSVNKSETQYYLSTSATATTGGTWSTTSPTWKEGTYVWTRTVTTSKDEKTVTYSNPACVTGNTGVKGDKGDTGATGTGVTKTYTQYYLSTSSTTQSGGSWSDTMPTWSSGKYIWQREVTVLDTGSSTYGTAVLANGLNSANQTANTANSTANTANTNASNAVSTANSALSTANNLKTLIRSTDDGVEVAEVDSSGNYTGTRTVQTASGLSIKSKDGTELASYGASTIELGKNDQSTAIEMCGGNISLTTAYDKAGKYYYGNLDFPVGAGAMTATGDGFYSQLRVRGYDSGEALACMFADKVNATDESYYASVAVAPSEVDMFAKGLIVSLGSNGFSVPTITNTSNTKQAVNLAYLQSYIDSALSWKTLVQNKSCGSSYKIDFPSGTWHEIIILAKYHASGAATGGYDYVQVTIPYPQWEYADSNYGTGTQVVLGGVVENPSDYVNNGHMSMSLRFQKINSVWQIWVPRVYSHATNVTSSALWDAYYR